MSSLCTAKRPQWIGKISGNEKTCPSLVCVSIKWYDARLNARSWWNNRIQIPDTLRNRNCPVLQYRFVFVSMSCRIFGHLGPWWMEKPRCKTLHCINSPTSSTQWFTCHVGRGHHWIGIEMKKIRSRPTFPNPHILSPWCCIENAFCIFFILGIFCIHSCTCCPRR